MKIAIIANGYPNKREPQWGCFEKDQALALQKLGHQVSILYVDARFRTYWRKIGLTCIKDEGLSVYGFFLLPLIWLQIMSKKAQYWISTIFLDVVFCKYIKIEGMPDVIYAHYIYNMAYAVCLKKKYRIPLIGIEHWSEVNKPELKPLVRYWGTIAYDNVDNLIAVSDPLRLMIKKHFGKESIVVHNMVGELFVNNPIIRNKNTSKIIFISVGSLFYVKGYDILIEAVAKISGNLPNWELRLIGEGNEHRHLQKMIDEYGLSDKILLLGKKNRQEIAKYLSESSIYISSSRSENFSVSVLEALAVGLPVVATICGGIRECINEHNGLLVPVEDSNALASGLIKMAEDYEKYNRKEIAEECSRNFAPHVIAQQLTDIFENVVKQ